MSYILYHISSIMSEVKNFICSHWPWKECCAFVSVTNWGWSHIMWLSYASNCFISYHISFHLTNQSFIIFNYNLISYLYLLVIRNCRINWWAPDKWWVGNNYLWAQCTVHRMHSFTQEGKIGTRNFNVSSFSSLGNKNVD